MNEKSNDFVVVLRFLLKWKYQLIIISFIGAVAGAVFSAPLFITPTYESSVIFYPSTAMSASKALVAEKSYSEDDFLSFGEDEEAEQLLQILKSDKIVEIVKDRYDLMDHYEIDLDEKYAKTKFSEKFQKNVKSSLTKYMSIQVTVRDKDPELAAKMANDIVDIMDSLRNNINRKRALEGLKIVEKDYNKKVAYLKTLVDSLSSLGEMGVMKLEQQAEVLTKAYTDALLKGNTRALKEINSQLQVVSKYGPVQEALAAELEFETEVLTEIRARYKEIQIDASSSLPNIFVVEQAYVPERKAHPVRWVITVLSGLGVFVFCIILFLLIDQMKKVKLDD